MKNLVACDVNKDYEYEGTNIYPLPTLHNFSFCVYLFVLFFLSCSFLSIVSAAKAKQEIYL